MALDKPLGYILGQTLHLVKLRLIAEFKEQQVELSFDLFVMLHFISQNEELTQQDLANHFQKDKSIVLRQISTLLEKRYVVRLPDKDDKRKKNLILTQKGYEALTFTKEISKMISRELLTGITEDEFDLFQSVLEKIQTNTGFEIPPCNC